MRTIGTTPPRAQDGTPGRDGRAIRHAVGTVLRFERGRLLVATNGDALHRIRLGPRTAISLAGYALSGWEALTPGSRVFVACVDSADGELGVRIELLAPKRARQGEAPNRNGGADGGRHVLHAGAH